MNDRLKNTRIAFLSWFFSFNILWRLICEITNVIVIMLTSYFVTFCLAHGLGRTKEWWYLIIGGAILWFVLYSAKMMQRKLGKTKLKF